MKPVMKGIDVSHWQGNVDFNKVKQQGFNFAIIKAGGADNGMYTDKAFSKYYEAALKAGLHVGAYYFTGPNFSNASQGIKEARHFISIIKNKKFDMPVAVDVEEVSVSKGKQNITDAVVAFCKEMEHNGYYVTIYASDISGFNARIDLDRVRSFDKWVARYNTKGPSICTEYGMWQYGGSVNYIEDPSLDGVESEAVDKNLCYFNYPDIIKNGGFNNYKKIDNHNAILVGPMSSGDYITFYKLITEAAEQVGNIKVEVKTIE